MRGGYRKNMPRDPEITHRIMSAIKSKGTEPERMLAKTLWKLGLRYRKHYKITGKPDFVFVKAKVAVFCDGDFWHGNNWHLRGFSSLDEELASYNDFWASKIRRNVERDKHVNASLEKDGWTVMRIWESEIRISPEDCANRILNVYQLKQKEGCP